MNTKFTPGPWHVINWGQQSQIRDKNHGEIAMLNREGNFNSGLPDEETRANAKLIAAAPEMLKALQNAAHWMKQLEILAPYKETAGYEALQRDKNIILEAIQKATV